MKVAVRVRGKGECEREVVRVVGAVARERECAGAGKGWRRGRAPSRDWGTRIKRETMTWTMRDSSWSEETKI